MTTINSAESLFSFMRNLDVCQRQDSLNQQLADLKPVLFLLHLNQAANFIDVNNRVEIDYTQQFFSNIQVQFKPANNFTNAAAVANFLGCYDAATYLTESKLI